MNGRLRISIILYAVLISFGNDSFSQTVDYSHYTPLKCSGTPPVDFLKPSYEKYYSDIADIKKNNKGSKKDRKLQKEFSFITNYKIDDILMSGKVLYGNKVSNYINAIAAKLLETEPELKSKMRFYLLNVSYANALSTNNGIVFVTTGLIAQLENEAQLAFVLSHEISHYKLNHSFESFKKTKDILVNRRYNDLGTDEKIIKILKYSKENESAADVEGLKIFAKAGYDKNEATKMMDILLYSYLPFDEVTFPKTFFNDSFYKVPLSYFRDSLVDISAAEDENDEESSHPNVEYRKSNLEKYISSNDMGTIFLISKSDFDEVLKLCRYEQGFLMLVKGNYTKVFYHAFLLAHLYGESTYTAELMMGALYGINKYKLALDPEKNDDEIKVNEKNYEGQISIPYYFFSGMRKDEFNVLASRTIFKLYEKYPSKYGYKISCDIFTDLLYSHKYTNSDFNSADESAENEIKDTVDIKVDQQTEESPVSRSSKVKKIKKKINIEKGASISKYYRNAFINEFKSPYFVTFIDSIEKVVVRLKNNEESMGLSELRSEPIRRYAEWFKDEKKIQGKFGKQLGIDSIIIISPSYSSVYFNPDENEAKTNNLDDELKAIEITKSIENKAKDVDLNMDIIDINRRGSLDSRQLNNYSALIGWMTEKYNHNDKNDILFSQKYIDSLVDKSGYKNVCFTGFAYKSVRRKFNGVTILLSGVLWIASPLIIGYSLDSDKKLDYYYVVVDMETGEQKMFIYKTINRRPKAKVINLQMAYTFYQVKAKPKNKRTIK